MSSYYGDKLLFDELSSKKNGPQFTDDIFKRVFLKYIFVFAFKFYGIVFQMDRVTMSHHLSRKWPRVKQQLSETMKYYEILLNGRVTIQGTNFNEISIDIGTFSFKKMHLKMSPGNGGHFVPVSMRKRLRRAGNQVIVGLDIVLSQLSITLLVYHWE